MLSTFNLENCGRCGDTVVSIYNRLQKKPLTKNYDISFLWIGTNDIYVHVSPVFPLIKNLLHQPWSTNHYEFKNYYIKNLDYMKTFSNFIITVSPLCIGEDLNNKWNKEIRRISKIIKDVSDSYENTIYLDLPKKVFSNIDKEKKSKYIQKSSLGTFFESIFLKRNNQINSRSESRGLKFTLDGIHLNSYGAEKIAEIFYEQIIDIQNNL